jgi:hypothetical protein
MVFDPAKLAASLTTATGLPYDSQHLPITAIRFVKNEGSIQFEVNVPRDAVIPGEKKTTGTAAATDNAANQQQEDDAEDAGDQPQQQLGGRGGGNFAPPPGRNQKQLAFEYELATGKLALLDEAARRCNRRAASKRWHEALPCVLLAHLPGERPVEDVGFEFAPPVHLEHSARGPRGEEGEN